MFRACGFTKEQIEAIPEPPAPEPDKNKIKEAIKNGIEVAGAEIEGRKSLSIK